MRAGAAAALKSLQADRPKPVVLLLGDVEVRRVSPKSDVRLVSLKSWSLVMSHGHLSIFWFAKGRRRVCRELGSATEAQPHRVTTHVFLGSVDRRWKYRIQDVPRKHFFKNNKKHILTTSFQYLKGYSCRILQNWCSQKRAGSEVTKRLDFIFESSLPLHVYVNIKLISSLGLGKRFCGVLSRPNIANKNLSLDLLRLSELVLVEPPDVLGASEARYKLRRKKD